MTNIPLIEAQEISFERGGREIASNINILLNKGEVYFVKGKNGCGKTTLLRLIAGFEDPISGQIEVGENIVFGNKYVPTEKRSIGMLFQDIALFPHLSVKNNIHFINILF